MQIIGHRQNGKPYWYLVAHHPIKGQKIISVFHGQYNRAVNIDMMTNPTKHPILTLDSPFLKKPINVADREHYGNSEFIYFTDEHEYIYEEYRDINWTFSIHLNPIFRTYCILKKVLFFPEIGMTTNMPEQEMIKTMKYAMQQNQFESIDDKIKISGVFTFMGGNKNIYIVE